MQIENKIAIITGASSGLGTAFAEALIKKGAEVYGLARNIDALLQIREKLGNNFHAVRLDISDGYAVNAWVDKTFDSGKTPDILINNAGVGSFAKIDEMEPDDWVKMVDTNLNGLYFITSRIASLMKENEESSHIVNIGSILGTVGRSEGTAYCATKFGVSGFSDALFRELRFFNIKVTCLNPGSIDTEFFKTSGIDAHHNMLQPKDLADTLIHILETPDNMLINEITVRPLNPKPPVRQ